jgi:hypothetical protein
MTSKTIHECEQGRFVGRAQTTVIAAGAFAFAAMPFYRFRDVACTSIVQEAAFPEKDTQVP